MTAHSTHLVLVPGLGCTEDLFAEQIATLRGDVAISVADHTRHDTISGLARAILAAAPNRRKRQSWKRSLTSTSFSHNA
jgi:hypothetical protein